MCTDLSLDELPSKPITGTADCATAVSGRQTAALPRSVMKSRRRIATPMLGGKIVAAQTRILEGGFNVRFGSKADIWKPMSAMGQKGTLALASLCLNRAPDRDRKSDV